MGETLYHARPNRQLTWLAVRASSRCQGAGSALVAEGLVRCEPGCDVFVDAFGKDNPSANQPDGSTRRLATSRSRASLRAQKAALASTSASKGAVPTESMRGARGAELLGFLK